MKKVLVGISSAVLALEALWLGSLIVRTEVKLRQIEITAEEAESDAARITHLYTQASRKVL
jgi:hypothetical protein